MSGLIDIGVFPGKEGIIQMLKMMPVMGFRLCGSLASGLPRMRGHIRGILSA